MTLSIVVSPLISLVVRKAGNSLIKQFCQVLGMKRNYEKLRRQFLVVQAVIRNAEERGENEPHVQAWLEDLNAAAYKAVDVLDEFQYEAFRRQAISQQSSSSSIKKVTRSLDLYENQIVFRYKMSKKLTRVLEKINEIISEMRTFSFITHDCQSVPSRTPTHSYGIESVSSRIPTHSRVIESEVVGRDSEKEKIVSMLLDPNRKMEDVSVLPIVGMGGAGKTTLAQLVYNEKKVRQHFKFKMWICVSNDFNVMNIVKSIIEVATKGQCMLKSNLEVLQGHLTEIFKNKRYLLVLDDVWNENIQKWDDLKTLLMCGLWWESVIVVTTRSKKIASMMGTLPSHYLVMLSEIDSWNLFRKRAFCEIEETQQFVEIGRKIVNKCGGLPLALKAIGGLMRTKRDICEWHSILENKIWENESSDNGILPALKLSYDHLPGYMKQCFAFCAIFPKDYEFQKETLINLWMANGFIENDETKDLKDKGGYIFDELCWMSFFQDIKEEEGLYGNIEVTCKMHDLMNDLAKHIAGKQCATAMCEVEYDKVLHLSVGNSEKYQNTVLKKFPVIRTCLIDGMFAITSHSLKHTDFVKLVSLRALKMKCTGQLPNALEHMKHLRYLDISCGNFDSLPETLSTLYNLQTLDISNSNICSLPSGMRYMISLENLKFDGCLNLKKLPIHIGKLKNLRTLTKYMIHSNPGHTIEELNNLNLHGRLILTGLENVRDKNEAKAANMISKSKLYSLVLNWDLPNNKEKTSRNDDEVLEGLEPCDLKHLYVSGYAGFEFAVWMKGTTVIRNLRTLNVYNCNNCTKLPPIWQLPLLENLDLKFMRSLVYICNTGNTEVGNCEYLVIFPNLIKLNLCYLDNLEGWHELDHKLVQFPKLEKLRISGCPKLKSVPLTPSLRKSDAYNLREIKLIQSQI